MSSIVSKNRQKSSRCCYFNPRIDIFYFKGNKDINQVIKSVEFSLFQIFSYNLRHVRWLPCMNLTQSRFHLYYRIQLDFILFALSIFFMFVVARLLATVIKLYMVVYMAFVMPPVDRKSLWITAPDILVGQGEGVNDTLFVPS